MTNSQMVIHRKMDMCCTSMDQHLCW